MRNRGGRLIRALMAILVFAGSTGARGFAEYRSVNAPEYAIKAVFLYNLVKYTDWPPESPLSDPGKPIVVAVIGEDPFGDALDEAVRGRTVRGRRIVIVRTSDVKSLKSVHIAFISSSESNRAAELVSILAARSVLTVGDTESSARAGVAVNFVMVEGRVRFDVNQAAAKRRHIELSSQLLKLARRVLEPED